MNFKTTIVLLVLVAAGATLFFVSARVPTLFESAPPAPDLGTRAALEKLQPADLTRIEIQRGNQSVILTREKGVWSMPGNWPTRTAEVNALADLLGGLRSRFEAIPINEEQLADYGLDKPATTIKLETEHAKYSFAIGETADSSDSNQFAKPTYLHLLSGPGVEKPVAEVVRLAPGLLALLERPADYYQRRRLFASERVPKDDDSTAQVEHLAARSIRVVDSKKTPGTDLGKKEETVFALAHNETSKKWELSLPERDRLDPTVSDTLLKTVPDLWAERFINVDIDAIRDVVCAGADFAKTVTALGMLALSPEQSSRWLTERAGLVAPERKIIVTRDNGDMVTLLIGGPITHKKSVQRPSPGGPMFEPIEETVLEEFRYAKLENNPQIFEIKAEGLKDIFVALDTLRDTRLARFSPADARELEIVQPDQKELIQLVKEKDRWKLVRPLQAEADSGKVMDLLTQLSNLQARGEDIVAADKHDAVAEDFDKPGPTITVKWETEKKNADGETKKTNGTAKLTLGKDDTEKKKLFVKADDWPRVNRVDDSLLSLVKRPALAYRGKRLLDFTANDVAALDVHRNKEKLTLKHDKTGWKLIAPVTTTVDGLLVNQLADALGKLEVVEYVDDAPKKELLDPTYGVGDAAPLVVTVTFLDASKPPQTLRLGKARDMKPEFFGKMDDGTSVFVVASPIHAQLDRDSLSYLPAELWQISPRDIAGVTIKKEGHDEYTLKGNGNSWQVTGPFEAPALASLANFVIEELAAPRCESHKAHEAKDLAEYGLDKPMLTVALLDKGGHAAHTLLIGKTLDKDSRSRYAKVADQPGICVIGEQLITAADRPALDLLDPTLLQLAAAKVERITTQSGTAKWTLQRTGNDWQVLDTPASPFPADKDALSPRQFPWANLNADKYEAYGSKVDWSKYGLDKPAVVVTVVVKDGEPKEHTIELGKYVDGDNGPRYGRVDKGQGVAVLNRVTTQLLARSYLDYVNRSVLQFKADEVTQLERKMGANLLELTRKDDAWQIVKPAAQRADDKGIQDLLAQLADLKAVRVAAFPATELKTYGLDELAAVVTIKLKADAKPAEYVIKLGKPADADGRERFAMVGDSKAVVVLPVAISQHLAAAPIAFRDRSLAKFADADKLRLERGPRKAVFARVDGSWKLTEPLVADADNDELDDFLNMLARLRADELIAEKPTADELKTYGLDKPEAHWKLMAGDTEVLNLVIGGREKVGIRRYAQLVGKDIVFLLDPKLSVRSLAEFRKREVWAAPLDTAQVDSVHFGYAKSPFVLEKIGPDEWRVEGKPDIKPNKFTVAETLDALARLKATRYVEDKDANFKLYGLDPAEVAIEIVSRSGNRTLYVGRQEGDSKGYYARVPEKNRSDVFIIDAADAVKILRDASALTKAPPRPVPPPVPPPVP